MLVEAPPEVPPKPLKKVAQSRREHLHQELVVEAVAFHLEEAREEEAYPGWLELPAQELVPRNSLVVSQMGGLVVELVLRIAALEDWGTKSKVRTNDFQNYQGSRTLVSS